MDLFVLVDPSVTVFSDDDDGSDSIPSSPDEVNPKRHMANSPPRPSIYLRKKSRQGSPNRGTTNDRKQDTDIITEDNNTDELSPPSIPSLSQRIQNARIKRHTLHQERIQTVAQQTEIRSTAALIRAESHLQSKVIKANRCDERLSLVQEKKLFIETERKVNIQTVCEQRAELALKRADFLLQQRRARALSIDRITTVRERKSTLENERVKSLQDTLETKSKSAAIRAQRTLQSRQKRASYQDRVARVKARRSLQEYERRTALLSSLDHKVERASRKLEELLQDRREKAGEEIRRARLVSRKVRAARAIQRVVRWKILGQARPCTTSTPTHSSSADTSQQQRALSHNEAAKLIQSWPAWQGRVAAGRFSKVVDEEYTAPRDALKILVGVVEGKDGQPPSFEEMRSKMIHPVTIQAARIFLEGLGHAGSELNDRTLLSAFLISMYPSEVLDDEEDKRAKMLAKASRSLIVAIEALTEDLSTSSHSTQSNIRHVCSRAIAYNEIFQLWKSADLDKLIGNMTKSAEQSWVAYLSSCEALSYMSELQGGAAAPNDQENHHDPLMSLRLRHEASKAGSRTHIKRLRVSLNKLVGTEEGRQLVKNAKESALSQIVEEKIVSTLKEEVNEHYQQGSSQEDNSSSFNDDEDTTITPSDSGSDDGFKNADVSNDESTLGDGIPSDIFENEALVHMILLTDPSDFNKLSWNGQATEDEVAADEYMARWIGGSQSDPASNVSSEKKIAESIKRAFFDIVTEDLGKGDYKSMQNMLLDLHEMMRKLVPNRPDLHSYLRDDEVKLTSSTDAVLALLLAAADALAKNLESPAQVSSTLDWITVASGADAEAKYGFASKEEYLVASCAFLLFKTESCQLDIANFRLMQAAPIIHKLGADYKLRRFKSTYELGDSPSIDDLKEKLPATNTWIVNMLATAESQAEIVRANSTAKRFACLKSFGFVDSLLFTGNELAVPEIFAIDAARIMHIRNEARYAVIGCALGLHICNAARARSSVFADVPLSSPALENNRQELASSLRAQYANQKQFFAAVAEVAISFAHEISGTSALTASATKTLKNCVAAVLRGFDPVLKLLDNRVKQFFRTMCKWQPSLSAPIPMQTGRSMLKGEDVKTQSTSSTKDLFLADATKEASKSGFSLYGDNLVSAGEMAYHVMDVAAKSYGNSILDRLLVNAAVGVSE